MRAFLFSLALEGVDECAKRSWKNSPVAPLCQSGSLVGASTESSKGKAKKKLDNGILDLTQADLGQSVFRIKKFFPGHHSSTPQSAGGQRGEE